MSNAATTPTDQERLLPMGQVCRRYSITDRTVDNWLGKGLSPEPVRINRLRYWRLSDLERFERESMTAPKRQPETAA